MVNLLEKSWGLLIQHFSRYVVFFLIQCGIQFLSPLSEIIGIAPGSGTSVWVEILTAVLTIWNFTFLLHILISIREKKQEDFLDLLKNATYDSPAFFLYSLLYGLTIFLGAIFLIIPGLYFMLFNYFGPLASVIDPDVDNGEDSYFSYSRKLVKPEWAKVLLFFVVLFILNGFVPSLGLIPAFKQIRLTLDITLIPLEVVMVLFGDILAVELYYYLKAKKSVSGDDY